MAKLIIHNDGNFLTEVDLSQDETTIGRRGTNDIVLQNDTAVSGQHACVRVENGVVTVVDMNSTNGTRVNEHPIETHVLAVGDKILIGRHSLEYQESEADQDTLILDTRGVMDLPDWPGEENEEPTESAPESTASPAPTEHIAAAPEGPKVEPQAEPTPVEEEVEPSAPQETMTMKIAKLPPATLQPAGGSGDPIVLSRSLTTIGNATEQLAAIARRPDGYFALCIVPGTGQAPQLNQSALQAEPRALSHGDTITLGSQSYRFEIVL